MTQQLENDLGPALAQYAAEVPPDSIERLSRIDYRPRTHRVSRRMVGASATVIGSATAVTTVLLTSAPSAYAGWSATPASVTAASATVNDECTSQLSALPGEQPDWSPVVTDVRGPYTLVVYQAGAAQATCLHGPSLTAVSVDGVAGAPGGISLRAGNAGPGQATGGTTSQLTEGGSGPIKQVSSTHLDSADGAYSVADGQVADDVSAVTLTLSDGSSVASTVNDGWFVAWWPNDEDATSAQVTTPSGTSTQPIGVPPPGVPAPTVSGSIGTTQQLTRSRPGAISGSASHR